jgi:hypothetical protein
VLLDWPRPGHFWIGRDRGNSCNLSDALLTNIRASTTVKILARSECRRFSHTWKAHGRDRTGWLG